LAIHLLGSKEQTVWLHCIFNKYVSILLSTVTMVDLSMKRRMWWCTFD